MGNGKIVDSHPDTGSRDGPYVRNLSGPNQFGAYDGEKVAIIKHRQAMGVAADVIAGRLHQGDCPREYSY